MKLSRTAIITAVAALASAGALAVTSAGPAAAMVGPPGVGTTTCSAGYTGKVTFLPALQTVGTSSTEEVAVTLNFTGCAGGTPVPVSGKYVAKGVVSGPGANTCANWFAPSVGTTPGWSTNTFNQAPLIGAITWSPASISPSKVKFLTIRIRTGAGAAHRLIVQLPHGTVGVSYPMAGTSVADLAVNPPQNYGAVTTACGGAGVSALRIVPTNPFTSTGTW
jgi:hypothetical protein